MGRYNRYDDLDEDWEHLDLRQPGRFEMPHTGAGLAALAMGAIALIGAVCATVVIVALDAAQPNPGMDEDLLEGLVGLLFLGCGTLAIGGFALGLAGSFQHDRNPLFGILGTVISALAMVGMSAVVCLGLLSDL